MATFLALVALLAQPAIAAPEPIPATWTAHNGAIVTATDAGVRVEAPAGGLVDTSAPLDWTAIGELYLDIATEAEATVEILLAERDRVCLHPGPPSHRGPRWGAAGPPWRCSPGAWWCASWLGT